MRLWWDLCRGCWSVSWWLSSCRTRSCLLGTWHGKAQSAHLLLQSGLAELELKGAVFLPTSSESCGYTCCAHLHAFRSSQSLKAVVTSPGSRAVFSLWGKSDEAVCTTSICISIMAVKRPNISYRVFCFSGSLDVKCSLLLRFIFLWLHVSTRAHGRGAACLAHLVCGRSFLYR